MTHHINHYNEIYNIKLHLLSSCIMENWFFKAYQSLSGFHHYILCIFLCSITLNAQWYKDRVKINVVQNIFYWMQIMCPVYGKKPDNEIFLLAVWHWGTCSAVGDYKKLNNFIYMRTFHKMFISLNYTSFTVLGLKFHKYFVNNSA